MEENILGALREIGLTEGEAKAYLALVTLGQSTVGHIVEKSGVTASKVYIILDRLIEKGLVGMSVEKGVKLFAATPPEQIITFLEKEEEKLSESKKRIESILPALRLKVGSTGKLPMIEYAKGYKGFESLYEGAIRGAKKGDKYITTAGREISFKMQAYWYKFNVITAQKGVDSYILYEDEVWYKKNPEIHKRKERKMYYPKVLDKKYSDLPNIVTVGEVSIIPGIEGGEVFTLVIRNKNLTDSFNKMIKVMWDAGYVPKGYKKKELKI